MWILQAARRLQARVLVPAALLCVSAAAFAAEQGAIRLIAGGSATLAGVVNAGIAVPEGAKFAVESEPASPYPFTAGVSASSGSLFVATTPTMPPADYILNVSMIEADARIPLGRVAVTVEPLPPVPQGERPPVVLLNGFDLTAATSGECALAEDSTATFGRLQEFLETDGATVFFFDNCRFGVPPIETLGTEFGLFLDDLENSGVERVDVVGFSMGGLIVRSYLAGKQVQEGSFNPPPDPRIRRAVFVGTPHFGTPLATLVTSGEQGPALRQGSRFSWDLARWHQNLDDLREIDAIAVAGSGARNGEGDGVTGLNSASLSSFALRGPEQSRILEACHNAPARILCSTQEVLMAVESEEHPTARIIRSFLGGTEDWRGVGVALDEHPFTSGAADVYLAVQDEAGATVEGVTSATATPAPTELVAQNASLTRSRDNVFFQTGLAPGQYLLEAAAPDGAIVANATLSASRTSTVTAKDGPLIARIIPAAGLVATLSLAGDSLVSIFGSEFSSEQFAASSLPWPTEVNGVSVLANGVAQELLFVGSNQINAYFEPGLTGLVEVTVQTPAGSHSVNVLMDAAVPAVFAINGAGSGPAAALIANTPTVISSDNPVRVGDFVSLFVTGLGATEMRGGFEQAVIDPDVFLGGVRQNVLYAGPAPGFRGLQQINIELVEGFAVGSAPLIVQSAARVSNETSLATAE